jgi:hypothetical protein
LCKYWTERTEFAVRAAGYFTCLSSSPEATNPGATIKTPRIFIDYSGHQGIGMGVGDETPTH